MQDRELSEWARQAFRPVKIEGNARALRERHTIVSTIQSTPNLGVAADKLGVSRKTLFNRMRELRLPPGKSGRPRVLPRDVGNGVAFLLLAGAAVGAGVLIGRWFKRRAAQSTVMGADDSGTIVLGDGSTASAYLHGTAVLASR